MSATMIVRADAGPEMGGGHLMRCLALAQEWEARGGRAFFLSHCTLDALRERVETAGIGFIEIGKPHPAPGDLATTLATLERIGKESSGSRRNWVVLDGYHFDRLYQQKLTEVADRLMVVDDNADNGPYHANAILNQNRHADRLEYDCDTDTELLLGTRYALLRPEFRQWREWTREINKDRLNVLVTLGLGADDRDNVTLTVLRALNRVEIPGIKARVAISSAHPHLVELEELAAQSKHVVSLLIDVTNMPEQMAWADVAVSAAGSTSWELAFMGLPSILVVAADNQRKLAERLAKENAAINLGKSENVSVSNVCEASTSLLDDPGRREAMSSKGRDMVDAEGARRVVLYMKRSRLTLRTVSEADCELLWKWASDPEVRRSSFVTDRIAWDEHVKWFQGKLNNPDCFQFIGLDDDNMPVGQIRFDVSGDRAEAHVSVSTSFRGMGYGAPVIRSGVAELVRIAKVRTVHAFVKPDNKKSIRAFQESGFLPQEMDETSAHNSIHLIWSKDERS